MRELTWHWEPFHTMGTNGKGELGGREGSGDQLYSQLILEEGEEAEEKGCGVRGEGFSRGQARPRLEPRRET